MIFVCTCPLMAYPNPAIDGHSPRQEFLPQCDMHHVPEQSPLSPPGENFLVEATTKDPLYCLPVNDADLRFVKVSRGNAVDSTKSFFLRGMICRGEWGWWKKKDQNLAQWTRCLRQVPPLYPLEKSKITVWTRVMLCSFASSWPYKLYLFL